MSPLSSDWGIGMDAQLRGSPRALGFEDDPEGRVEN